MLLNTFFYILLILKIMKILIAEDDEFIANSLKKNFIEEGFEVDIAVDGKIAYNLILEKSFDIVLLDWRMPNLSGIQLCGKLRKEGYNKPIILLTALSDVANKIEALNLGAYDYITKPFSFDEILARINAINRRYQNITSVISFDDITLNPFTRVLKNNVENIKLTEKEFDLLKYFYDNKGQILSKEILCKDVWQLPFTPDTNLVEVTVKNLRKKLESTTAKKYIQTIYGEGYLFLID